MARFISYLCVCEEFKWVWREMVAAYSCLYLPLKDSSQSHFNTHKAKLIHLEVNVYSALSL